MNVSNEAIQNNMRQKASEMKTEAKKTKSALKGETAKAEGTKQRRQSKEKVRKIFLSRLPRGKIAVEIGVWQGDFSGTILEYIDPKVLYLIDPWENVSDGSHTKAFVGRTENSKMERIYKKVQKRYEDEIEDGRVEIVRDWSVNALEKFKKNSINFAYVDGDHSYEGVTADLKALSPKMAFGGIMAFDDYHRRGWWGDGVIRAINEFLGQYPDQWRVRTVAGAQIAIEKLRPLSKK